MYAAIIAGGSGTRLWPRSRVDKPKQFHILQGDKTLLQQTVNRLESLIPQEKIFVIANKSHKDPVQSQLEWLTDRNFVGEPVAKNTAPAVGIIATLIGHYDPEAVILVTPADHVILKQKLFRRLLEVAEKVASEGNNVVTIGIKPNCPETGYGYIQMTEEKQVDGDVEIHRVASFKEKPDLKTAEDYVSSWHYVWNSGMFIWSVKTIMNLYRDHAPDIYKLLIRYDGAIDTPNEQKVIEEVYDAFPSISVDYAIMEHAENIHVIPASIGWSDLGSWASVYEMMDKDESGNAIVGNNICIDTHNCLIHSTDRMIATVGLDNMIVVDGGDVILVMPKGRSQDVKVVLDEIKKQGKLDIL